MLIDVERVYVRRANVRWEREHIGDIFERVRWSRPDAIAEFAAPCALRDPQYAAVSWRKADLFADRVAHALIAEGLHRSSRVALLCE